MRVPRARPTLPPEAAPRPPVLLDLHRHLPMSELLALDEVARRLGGISRRTVYRLIADRKLRVTKVRGSSFVTEVELERYIRTAERPGRVA
jgi:excisionase family DNA binding protein